MSNTIIELKKENGKKITIGTRGLDVTVVVWRKNDSPFLPLVMSRVEAHRLKIELEKAIAEANANAVKP